MTISPAPTESPSETPISDIVPSTSEDILFSIFIASRTQIGSPASISEPSSTRILTIVPCIGATTCPLPEPEEDEPEEDVVEKSEPEMVMKSQHEFSTETPRPGSVETVDKSFTKDFSPILKDARAEGYEGLSIVAQNILSGKYYKPTPEEVGGY